MTRVEAVKVDALAKVVGREGVTTGSLMKDRKLEETFGPGDKMARRFDLLMALYVLTAVGRVDMERSGRNLVFSRKRDGG